MLAIGVGEEADIILRNLVAGDHPRSSFPLGHSLGPLHREEGFAINILAF